MDKIKKFFYKIFGIEYYEDSELTKEEEQIFLQKLITKIKES